MHTQKYATDLIGTADISALAGLYQGDLPQAAANKLALGYGYTCIAGGTTGDRVSAVALEEGLSRLGWPDPVTVFQNWRNTWATIVLPDAVVHIGVGGNMEEDYGQERAGEWRVWWNCYAASMARACELSALLKETFFLLTPADDSLITVTFWSAGRNGPSSVQRALSAPGVEALANYPEPVRESLEALLNSQDRAVSGRLLLLSGAPGTGKTSFIRLLARQWKPWCEAHYINDPEQFLGSAQYMTNVLVQDEAGSFQPAVSARLRDGRWKLVILEDSDEFLSIDAKDRSGQALQRLLNLGDGFLGQGSQCLILLTTNEPIEKIHPAIVRPGRMMADIRFAPFERQEALGWLREKGIENRSVRPETTLAELYEMVAQSKVTNASVRKPMGFVA